MNKSRQPQSRRHQRPFYQRVAIDIAGFGLIILAALTGWLPGPGGIPLFLIGLGILSLNYEWAERLLKNFDAKRREYTDKYLMATLAVSRTMDGICIVLLLGGIYGLLNFGNLWLRGISAGLIILAIITLLSNQKRFERLTAHFKK
jgi:hypothetical protein